MNIEPMVVWEKWKDPLGFDDQETEELDRNKETSYNDDDEDQYPTEPTRTRRLRCTIINTPFGMIPVDENTASTQIFNFWSGHTNFPITEGIARVVEETEGVETLNVFTKYRLRIAVGKAFLDSIVLRTINKHIYSYIKNNDN